MNAEQRARVLENARGAADRARAFREEERVVGISPLDQEVEALRLTVGTLADALALLVAVLVDDGEAQERA